MTLLHLFVFRTPLDQICSKKNTMITSLSSMIVAQSTWVNPSRLKLLLVQTLSHIQVPLRYFNTLLQGYQCWIVSAWGNWLSLFTIKDISGWVVKYWFQWYFDTKMVAQTICYHLSITWLQMIGLPNFPSWFLKYTLFESSEYLIDFVFQN